MTEPTNVRDIKPTDPDDLSEFIYDGDGSDSGVERVVLSIPVRKPKKHEFFRINPDSAMRLEKALIYDHETDAGVETFLVTPAAMGLLDEGMAKMVRLFMCTTVSGSIFLWPARLPNGVFTGGDRWARSGLLVADEAQKTWVRMTSDKAAGAYVLHRARTDQGEPQWGRYKRFREVLDLAFENGRVIRDADHHVIKALKGE